MATKFIQIEDAPSVATGDYIVGTRSSGGTPVDYKYTVDQIKDYVTADIPQFPAVVALYERRTGRTSSVILTSYSVGALLDETIQVNVNLLVTTATSFSFYVNVAYTDEGNTARTAKINFADINGTIAFTLVNATGAIPYSGIPLPIRCKAGTTVTISTTGTFTSVTYNIEATLLKLPNI